MHSKDPNKPWDQFWQVIRAILAGTSLHHRLKERLDFRGFVFSQNADFSWATFQRDAIFSWATFLGDANFSIATFQRDAYFFGTTFQRDAYFSGATFHGAAYFLGAGFQGDANFGEATFRGDADFGRAEFSGRVGFFRTTVGKVLSLHGISVAADGEVILHRVNQPSDTEASSSSEVILHRVNQESPGGAQQGSAGQASSLSGLRLRLRLTLLDRLRFEDVRWHQQGGRLVLQDELDLKNPEQDVTHELVADAYRRLVNNFERGRQYELAEQAVVGEMEMRRCNPQTSLLTRLFLGMYKLLSVYGSSFGRALFWLSVFVLVLFPLLFPAAGLQKREPSSAQTRVSWWEPWGEHTGWRRYWYTFQAGLVATLETATLQREPGYRPANDRARLVGVAELVVIPGQLTLFLLALRRRFRR
ncbi:MAG: pentapeptide repeat-containing protein [Acidobacteriia bacterium]|jgi:hypothetical protein|nr:pentapeptide repeat-containing protein [Terriglobia bacterium]